MSVNSNKNIGIICNSKELFLAFRRALYLFLPGTIFYFIDTNVIENQSNIHRIPSPKKAGILIAFFSTDEENQKVCQSIKFLRIKGRLQYPLIFYSFSNEKSLLKLFDILTYGENSHRYLPLPLNLHTFIDAIPSLIPMSDGNYTNFCKEYSERHKDFYKEKILPLLETVNKTDAIEKWLNDFELLVEDLISKTPSTCHKKIEFQGVTATLGYHLKDEILKLKKSKGEQTDLTRIKGLLNSWYKFVTNHFFE